MCFGSKDLGRDFYYGFMPRRMEFLEIDGIHAGVSDVFGPIILT